MTTQFSRQFAHALLIMSCVLWKTQWMVAVVGALQEPHAGGCGG